MTNRADGPDGSQLSTITPRVPAGRMPSYRPPRTYGELQESAATMLRLLIASDDLPVIADDVDQMLQCRDAVIDALRQQLRTVGLNNHYPAHNHPGRLSVVALTEANERLPTLLDQMAFELPTLPPGSYDGSVDALGTPSAHPTVEMWRESATSLLAAAHALDSAQQRTWLRDDAAGWWLVRDSATTLEAVLVLDERLAEVGLLNAHEAPHLSNGTAAHHAIGLTERRMLASQCARVASWYGTSDLPDRAVPGVPLSEHFGPVKIVRTTADIAPAQANLARYLRPRETREAFSNSHEPIDATTAKRVVASQLMLHRCFRHLALVTDHPSDPGGTQRYVDHFTERIELLAHLQEQIHDLVDLRPEERKSNVRITWQQGELTSSLGRMRRAGVLTSPTAVTPDDLREITRTSHAVTRNLSVSLRRDLLQLETGLLERTATGVTPSRIRRRHPIERSLTELVNAPALVPTPPPTTVALQRAALRTALDTTPSAGRTPSPWPAARKDVGGPPL
ncbi:hypothetical protein RDV89_17430 [Nocardioides zeae]|uniref:Uncharacterized protein n=1 Tax=Nocardioides imazamoxiresistens TaxID=3231893 RepID=A0ABU3Q0I1_9ACTN|nr:hypothetical protein [Nocardioides zeae]MDT9594874.1 hypothetical protein [Nocardioides zeae]